METAESTKSDLSCVLLLLFIVCMSGYEAPQLLMDQILVESQPSLRVQEGKKTPLAFAQGAMKQTHSASPSKSLSIREVNYPCFGGI